MTTLRKFGTDFVGDIPWGTHLCQFYETKEDLVDILVPYFAEGLKSNEACMWVTSEPLDAEDATAALAQAVPNLDRFIRSGQLKIFPYHEWYLKDGTFDQDRVLQAWVDAEQSALTQGFEGVRLSGNTMWIERSLWDAFVDYEAAINTVIGGHRMLVLCTYSLTTCGGTDVIDVVRNHEGTIIKQGGTWTVVEDVVRRKRAEDSLTQEASQNAALTRLTERLLTVSDADTLTRAILDETKRLTGSRHGFVALIDPKTKDMVSYGHTAMMVDECGIPAEKRQIRFPIRHDGIYRGLSAHALNVKRGFFTNDPSSHPAAAGAPAGHVPLAQFCAVPALVGDEVVGQIALANPGRDYTDDDVALVERFADVFGLAVVRERAATTLQEAHEDVQMLNEELQSTNEELRTANEDLDQRVRERTAKLQETSQELAAINEELQSTNEELRYEIDHRTRLERVARENAERTVLLNRIITLANEHTTVQTYVGAMLDLFVRELDFETATLRFRKGDMLELYDSRGLPAQFVKHIQQESVNTSPLDRIYAGEPYVDESYVDSDPARAQQARISLAIGIPLVAHDRVIGNFGLGGDRARALTSAEIETLTAIGHEAGTAIARLRAQERLTHELAITETITRLTPPLLFPSLDVEGLMLAILDDAKRLTGSAHGFIGLIDPRSKDLIGYGHTKMMLDECAIPEAQRQVRFPIGSDGRYRALWGYALNGRQGFFTNTPADHPASMGTPEGHATLEKFLAVPAVVGNEVVGEIALANPGRDYTERDAALVGRLAEELFSLAVMRMRAEEELRSSSRYARNLIEASLDPLVTINAEGIITDVNTATEEATGCSRDELIGSDFSDYFTEPDKAAAGYQHTFADGFIRDYPLVLRHKSGRVIDVLYNATVYRNDAGDVQGVFAAARDITERKRAEAAVREYARQQEVINNIIRAGNEAADLKSAIISMLDHAVSLTGFEAGAVYLLDADQRVAKLQYASGAEAVSEPQRVARTNRHVAGVYGGAPSFVDDHRAFRSPRYHAGAVAIAHVPLASKGEVIGHYVVSSTAPHQFSASEKELLRVVGHEAGTVIARLQAEEALQRYSGHLEALVEERTAQLRDSERLAAIGQTAAMIGHDLRNPLQGLQYIVDLQKLRFERMSWDQRGSEEWTRHAQLLDKISEQITYMNKIVDDLQDYARPITPESERVSVRAVIDDVLQALPEADSVEIVTDLSDMYMMADAHFMRRAFSNLILNAVQAMPDGGTLTIRGAAEGDSVAIHVVDTGVGIPHEMRDKLFSPLATGKAKGTGLGLAVVKRIVEAHNGTIAFESEEGKGTTFVVTLPQRAE